MAPPAESRRKILTNLELIDEINNRPDSEKIKAERIEGLTMPSDKWIINGGSLVASPNGTEARFVADFGGEDFPDTNYLVVAEGVNAAGEGFNPARGTVSGGTKSTSGIYFYAPEGENDSTVTFIAMRIRP